MEPGSETAGSELSWHEVSDGACGLRVVMPANPVERRVTESTSVGPVLVRGWQAERDGTTYLATCSRIPNRVYVDDCVKIFHTPLERLVVGGKRRRPLGERLSGLGNHRGPREEDFALPKRRDGVPRIARRRWIERQGHYYQAIVVLPTALDASPVVERFLKSLAAGPIALDRRGLTPAWKWRVADPDHGFAVLWPERLDDFSIHVSPLATGSVHQATYFAFHNSLGVAVSVHDYYAPWLRPRDELQINSAEISADVRDRFLADHNAQLLAERLLVVDGGIGCQFAARFRNPTAALASAVRPRPPGPGAVRVEARVFTAPNRAWLVYATTSDDQEHRGVTTFLDSFEQVEV